MGEANVAVCDDCKEPIPEGCVAIGGYRATHGYCLFCAYIRYKAKVARLEASNDSSVHTKPYATINLSSIDRVRFFLDKANRLMNQREQWGVCRTCPKQILCLTRDISNI